MFILYDHRIHCPYSHCGCYQCNDSIMFAVYFHGSFSTGMALGQMSVGPESVDILLLMSSRER